MLRSRIADGVNRNSLLIMSRTDKMALPYVRSTVCVAAVTAVDSLIAGISIGSEALAAMAAAGPILALEQILHCLLGYGIDKLMIRYIGKGKRKEANRIFGSVLIAVTAVYLAVMIPLLLFERPVLRLFLKDDSLIEAVIRYTFPVLAASTVFEVLLCIERAFRVDGRSKLFSMRGPVTNIANILFDFLFVTVFGSGISGLAWASVISTAVGYTISLSHFFSKKRTVSPDLSVIFSPKELLSYVKQDMQLGTTATLDELLESLVISTQTAAISAVGGTSGLAIWSVFKTVRGIVISIDNGISASVSVYAGLMYGEKDYDGARFSLHAGLCFAFGASVLAGALICIFAGSISALFRIEPEYQVLCAQCLRIGSAAFPAISFLTVFGAFLPSVNRIKRANMLVTDQKLLPLIAAGIGYMFGMSGILTSYVIAIWISALVFTVLLIRNRFAFIPKNNPETICCCSAVLNNRQIADVCSATENNLLSYAFPKTFCSKVALVIEESLNYILRYNTGNKIRADIKVNRSENGVCVMITDDGSAYNPISSFEKTNVQNTDNLEEIIIMGLSSSVDYDRALDLNRLSITINKNNSAYGT